jgi:hypothetical protein
MPEEAWCCAAGAELCASAAVDPRRTADTDNNAVTIILRIK